MATPEELYKRGADLFNANNRAKAYQLFVEAAVRGHAEAQNLVGRYLEEGWGGIEKDPAAAVEWFRKAAEQGNATAQANLAADYHNGSGVEQNHAEAFRWYRKAAEQDNTRGQYMVGRHLDEGWGDIAKDWSAAVGWYRAAAEKGHMLAQRHLAKCLNNGRGVAQDMAEAYRWYRKAAEQGEPESQNMVGRYLEEGWGGVSKNPAEANEWYRKAAEQGNADAQVNLAYNLHNGVGLAKDRAEAYRWFLKAAEQGRPRAQNMVGRYLEEGWGGVAIDLSAATSWYRKAADQGLDFGQNNYAECLFLGKGVAEDKAEAYLWYRKAAEQGYAYSQYIVGCYLEKGWGGVTKNLAEAAAWFKKAADQGRDDAKKALERLDAVEKSSTKPASAPPSSTPAPAAPPSDPKKELEQLLAELDALTGLDAVKREIHRRVVSVQLNKLRGDSAGHGSLHMVFSGNPGTGKTTVARLVGRIYHALGLVRDGDLFVECGREDLVARYIGQTAPKVKEQVEKALGGILFIDEAYSLYKQDDDKDFGNEAIDTLVKAMEDHRDELVVIMAGYTDEMHDMVKNANPGLASRFRTWVEFEDYTADDLAEIAEKMVASRNRTLGEGAGPALHELIGTRSMDPAFGNARGVRNLLDDIQDIADERLAKRLAAGEQLGEAELRRIEASDIEKLLGNPASKAESLDDLLAELDSLTGLASAKRAIRIRVAEAKHAARAKAAGAAVDTGASSLHMIFAGNPGTGKTTVARLVGRIYHALGIVRDAYRFVECKREDLVAGYVGQTAPKVKEQVEKALGGILFIDEAYSLYSQSTDNNFGAEAIDALVALMEDHRDDLVVIMAGYTDEMRAMIAGANPGLKSRFRTWIEFEDYTVDELVSIFEGMASHRGIRLGEGCLEAVSEAIATRSASGDFGNARGVRNLLDDAIERQILRLAREGDAAEREGRELAREDYETLRAVDIPPAPKAPQKMRFGFA